MCCDVCNDGIHVHMQECPSCKKSNAASNIYGNLYEAWSDNEIPEFNCEECKAMFMATKTFKEIREAEGIYTTEWNKV